MQTRDDFLSPTNLLKKGRQRKFPPSPLDFKLETPPILMRDS